MMIAFSVAPVSEEMSEAVARAVKIVRDSGLPNETNAMFTLIEGEWDEVMDVVKRATDAVLEVSPRASLVIKADIRPGWNNRLTGKVEDMEKAMKELN